jgi:glutathione S-transferase
MTNRLVLMSHTLCPYVQRAAIVLAEKSIDVQRIDIDLRNKPDWFLKISPLGKTPVLQVGDEAIFESAVICEYLDETRLPKLHPVDALERAQHRAWMEFGSALLNVIAGFYSAPDERTLLAKSAELTAKFVQIEATLKTGPYFAGSTFSMVDAVFGPIFRYFDVFDAIADFGWFANTPKVCAWRRALAVRDSVKNAVGPEYPALLRLFLSHRNSALSARMTPLPSA